jgi:hypothetical protein
MEKSKSFSELDIEEIDELQTKLWSILVPDLGECRSIQGDMIRAMGRFSSEMVRNLNNNWIYGKFNVNEDGYPQGYIDEYEDRDEDYAPDISKCKTTQEQLNQATLYDTMLNQTQSYLKTHPLPEWDDAFQKKLNATLEMARPNVPIGVISDEHWEQYDEAHDRVHNEGWDALGDDDSDFANTQIVYWIYRNPDLLDGDGKPLNESVEQVFKNIT